MGVIGCGTISEEGHLPGYARVPGTRVQAVADIDESRLRRVARRFRIDRCYSRYEDLLEKETEIDAVSICLPTFLHKDAVMASIEAGKHVLCEKPLALNTREGIQMVRSAKSRGVKLFVGFCLRFSNALSSLRRVVESNSLGEPLKVETETCFPREVDKGSWYFDRSKGGGALFDTGAHSTDMLGWIFGQGTVTSATFEECEEIPQLDMESTVEMQLENHVEGQIRVSWNSLPRQYIKVKCTEGTIGADLVKSTVTVNAPKRILGRLTQGVEISVEQTLPYIHEQVWCFASSVLENKNKDLLATGTDGLRALEPIGVAYDMWEQRIRNKAPS